MRPVNWNQIKTIFGQRLAYFREKNTGLGQQDFAKKAKLSAPTVARIETGVVSPTMRTLLDFLAACDVSLGEFFLPWLEEETTSNRHMEEEARGLFDEWITRDATRDGLFSLMKMTDDAYGRRKKPP